MDEGSDVKRDLPAAFLGAAPFVPSHLRVPEECAEPAIAAQVEVCVPPESLPATDDSLALSMEQYDALMQLIPPDVQDLIQVNLSHLRATGQGAEGAGNQSLQLRAISSTFDQLSPDQLESVDEAWKLVFGGEETPGVFSYNDDGLLPEEEEWLLCQMMSDNRATPATRNEKRKSKQKHRRK